MKYGNYTKIDDEILKSSDGKIMVHVKCACGKEEYKRLYHLTSGRCIECRSCSAKRRSLSHKMPSRFEGVGGLSKTHYSSIKYSAENRDLDFNVSIEFLWNLYEQQKGICALTGVELVLEPAIKNTNPDWSVITASLDRIDNSRGYEEDNVWWVHKTINRIKNNYSVEELKYWAEKFLSRHGNPDPSTLNANKVGVKEQRLGGEDATNNPPKSAQLPSGR